MKRYLTLVFLCFLFGLSACSSLGPKSKIRQSDLDSDGKIRDLEKYLKQAEEKATPEAKTVLVTGRRMVEKGKVIRGSCWDFANSVYNKAGHEAVQRLTPLKSKITGPYADLETIREGDWLYFINYSFKESDHSGIFVAWTDFENKRGIILSYIGGKKRKPGSYKIYDLKHVYYIIRPHPGI